MDTNTNVTVATDITNVTVEMNITDLTLTTGITNVTLATEITDVTLATDNTLEKGREYVYFVIITTLIPVGFLGNSLILLTMRNSKFSKTSTSIYLTVLSVTDSLTLFAGIFTLDSLTSRFSLGFNLRNVNAVSCVVLEFLYFWPPQTSSWCIVTITVERLIVLLKPHRSDALTRYRVRDLAKGATPHL